MPRRKYGFDENTLNRYLGERRGSGNGIAYRRWYGIHDVASVGASYRLQSRWTNGREVHLFSTLERDWFYVLDWSPNVIDIREQFPLLPLDATRSIAEDCGIIHPRDCKTRYPVVMTTDFLVTVRQPSGEIIEQARTVKYGRELRKARVREKFELERRYWAERGIGWEILEEDGVSKILARNIEILRGYVQIQDRLDLQPIPLADIALFLTQRVAERNDWLIDILNECDEKFAQPVGTALTIAYHLLANRVWETNLHEPIIPHRLLTLDQVSMETFTATLFA